MIINTIAVSCAVKPPTKYVYPVGFAAFRRHHLHDDEKATRQRCLLKSSVHDAEDAACHRLVVWAALSVQSRPSTIRAAKPIQERCPSVFIRPSAGQGPAFSDRPLIDHDSLSHRALPAASAGPTPLRATTRTRRDISHSVGADGASQATSRCEFLYQDVTRYDLGGSRLSTAGWPLRWMRRGRPKRL